MFNKLTCIRRGQIFYSHVPGLRIHIRINSCFRSRHLSSHVIFYRSPVSTRLCEGFQIGGSGHRAYCRKPVFRVLMLFVSFSPTRPSVNHFASAAAMFCFLITLMRRRKMFCVARINRSATYYGTQPSTSTEWKEKTKKKTFITLRE